MAESETEQTKKSLAKLRETNLKIWEDHEASFKRIFYAICGFGSLIAILLFFLILGVYDIAATLADIKTN